MKYLLSLLLATIFLIPATHAQIRKKNASSGTLVVKTKAKKKPTKAQGMKIVWISPDRNDKLTENVDIKVMIESGEKVYPDQVTVLRNGEKAGAKGEVISFKALTSESKQLNFESQVTLMEGVNKLEIRVTGKDGQVQKSYPKVLVKEGDKITELSMSANDGGKGIFWERPQWSSNPVVLDERQFQIKVLINSV